MAYFLSKLIPPRKTFSQDMMPAEARAMRAHQDYWLPHLDAGLVIAMGPVADPEGGWTVMIAVAPSLVWLEEAQRGDPALAIGCRFENLVMPALKVAPAEPLAPVSSISP